MSSPSLAAVLFTDLVDSTAQRSELGEGVAEELRRTHDRLLTDAVEAHGGRVVKSTGDGIMATFSGASEAAAGAVAIQQAIDRHNRRADALAPLSVRSGVSLGDVTWEDDDVFGTPVIEAARICAQARGGQILAADVVRLLAGTRTGDRFVPVGDLDLKGLTGPTVACEICWEPSSDPVIPVPGGLRPVGGFSFVGRLPELAVLTSAWDAVVAGGRRAVFVAGEPGIGKTRLISQFAPYATTQGGVVLYGRAEQELGIPYKPIVEALTTYIRTCPDRELAAQMGSLSGELTDLVPLLAEKVPNLPGPLRAGKVEVERWRLFEAAAELVSHASSSWPLVMAIDDLQWAAKSTVLLARHLLHTDMPMRLLLVGCYRDTEVGADHPLSGLLAETHRIPDVATCTLSGLTEPDVVTMTAEATGTDQGGRLTSDLYRATDGNPFFVSEVLRAITSSTEPGQAQEVDLTSLGVPTGAMAMVAARVATLDPHHQPVLEAAAAIGQRFDLPLLCAVISDDDLVLRAMSQAEATGLVGTEELLGGRQFAHALIRDALYARLTPSSRVRLHGRVVDALERLPGHEIRMGELAHHCAQALPLVGAERTVDYARRAGDQARAKLAFEEAVEHYRRALTVLDSADLASPSLRCDLQIALGEVLHRAGDPSHRTVLLDAADAARRLGDHRRLGEAVLALNLLGWFTNIGVVDHDIVTLCEAALTGLAPDHRALRARVLAVLAAELVNTAEHDRRIALSHEAVEIARQLDDPSILAQVLVGHYWAANDPDNLEERLNLVDELVELGDRLDDPEARFRGLLLRCDTRIETGDLPAAACDLEQAGRLAQQLRQPFNTYNVNYRHAYRSLLGGRFADAEQLATEAHEHGTDHGIDPTWVMGVFGNLLGWVRMEQGRLAEMEGLIRDMIAMHPALPWRAALALLHCETGNLDEARAEFEILAAEEFRGVPRDYTWLETVAGILARTCSLLEDTEQAAILYRQLAPYGGQIASTNSASGGPVDTGLGLLASVLSNYDVADRHFAAAAELCERNGMLSWLARTRCDWAQMLVARDRPGDAARTADMASRALAAAEEIGMQRVARQAQELLAGTRT